MKSPNLPGKCLNLTLEKKMQEKCQWRRTVQLQYTGARQDSTTSSRSPASFLDQTLWGGMPWSLLSGGPSPSSCPRLTWVRTWRGARRSPPSWLLVREVWRPVPGREESAAPEVSLLCPPRRGPLCWEPTASSLWTESKPRYSNYDSISSPSLTIMIIRTSRRSERVGRPAAAPALAPATRALASVSPMI